MQHVLQSFSTRGIHLLLIFVATTGLCLTSSGQLMKLTGFVTDTEGIFDTRFSAGNSVAFSVDLTPPLVDSAAGEFLPTSVVYSVPAFLEIDGQSMLPISNVTFFMLREPNRNGLFTSMSWSGDAASTSGHIAQDFYSNEPILPSFTYFPAGIAMDRFTSTAGSYENDDLAPTGAVSWVITGYTGFGGAAPAITPVPEPATFGLASACALLGFIWFRGSRRMRVSQS